MSVNNNGFNVVISGINTLSNFTASNVKIQDNYIYTITNNAKGNDANGAMLLSRSGANNIILDGRNTYICTVAQINGGTTNDPVYDNTYISIKDSVLIMKTSVVSEIIAPMKGNDNTQIHFKTTGCTWNSKHSGTELKGSTIFFEGGGDGHLGKHKLAKVENVKMIWKATSRNEFVLGMHPNWDDTDKPSPMKALRFISVLGNDYISFKTVKMNTSNINLSLPKYTELETNISTDSISTVMNAINSSLNSNFEFVHDKLSLVDNKLVSLGTINEKITEIKSSTRKKEGTKLS